MNLRVKYFGMLAETVDKQYEVVTFTNKQISVLELVAILLQNYPQLKSMSFKVAVNQNIAENDQIINEGDEIALLPPFAGG